MLNVSGVLKLSANIMAVHIGVGRPALPDDNTYPFRHLRHASDDCRTRVRTPICQCSSVRSAVIRPVGNTARPNCSRAQVISSPVILDSGKTEKGKGSRRS